MVNDRMKFQFHIKVIVESKTRKKNRVKANPGRYLGISSRRRRRRVSDRAAGKREPVHLWPTEGVLGQCYQCCEKLRVSEFRRQFGTRSLWSSWPTPHLQFLYHITVGAHSHSNSTRFAMSPLLGYSLCLLHPNLSHQDAVNFATFTTPFPAPNNLFFHICSIYP